MAKIAISLPDSVLDAVEKERAESGETRSEFVRRALERSLKESREREQVKRYVEGYRRMPESDEEIALAEASIAEVFAENPWDESEDA